MLIRPRGDPGTELTRALGGKSLGDAIAELAPGGRIVVAIDQLEEVFTVCEREEERAAFLDQLATAARDPGQRAIVLTSLRTDFYGAAASYPAFAELLSGHHVLVGPMGPDELAQAIVGPASRGGLTVEEPLVQTLVSSVAGEPGGLPLLSTMLLELWQGRDGRTLRLRTYAESGGVHGAVARLAERAFAELDDHEREIARRVMVLLVGDEDPGLVRRRVPLAELHRIDGAEAVIDRLTQARLLSTSEGACEVSHEALVREWPRYRTWLEESRLSRQLHAHLLETARDWNAHGRDPGGLYRGTRLTAAIEWADAHGDLLDAVEREFLRASERHAEEEARRRRTQHRRLIALLAGVLSLLVIAVIAGVIAASQRESARNEARIAVGRALSLEAGTQSRPDVAMLMAREAVRLDPSPQSDSVLLGTLLRNPRVVRAFPIPVSGAYNWVGISPDATTVAVQDPSLTLRFYALRGGGGQRASLTTRTLEAPSWSPDGSRLAYVPVNGATGPGGSPELVVRNARSMAQIAALPFGTKPTDVVPAQILCSRRRTVYCVYVVLPLRLNRRSISSRATYVTSWSLPDGVERASRRLGPTPQSWASLADGGRRLVVFDGRHVTTLASASLRVLGSVAVRPPVAEVVGAAVSPDGRSAVASSGSGAVDFVDLLTGRVRSGTGAHDPDVNGLSFSPDGGTVAMTTSTNRLIIWNSHTASVVRTMSVEGATSPGFSARGGLFTPSAGGLIVQWAPTARQQVAQHAQLIGTTIACCGDGMPVLALSPDGERFAVRLGLSSVALYATATLQPEGSFTTSTRLGGISAIRWSQRGSVLRVAGSVAWLSGAFQARRIRSSGRSCCK